MRKTNSKKQLDNWIIGTVAATLLCIILINRNQVARFADSHILLENTNPKYMLLINSKEKKTLLSSIVDAGTTNLIVSTMTTTTYDQGYTITVNEDGSFTYSGTNNSSGNAYNMIASDCLPRGGGTYIVSDTARQGDLEPSQNGIYVFLEKRIYDIGGAVEYPASVALTNGTVTVTKDENDRSYYYLILCISPGYSSDGLTFYPMITALDQSASSFQPCVIQDTTQFTSSKAGYDNYNYYTISKNGFLKLTSSELRKLFNVLNYQTIDNWTTIDFQDGTGLVYSRDDGKKIDSENLVYGVLDTTGRVATPLGGIEDVTAEDKPLNEITIFSDYIEKLNDPNYTILIAVKDEGFSALVRRKNNQDLQALGMKTVIRDELYRQSYYAVLNPGTDAIEKESNQELVYSGSLSDGTSYQILSCGTTAGDAIASIMINGQEWSMNERGMNFVVYDNSQHKVVDTVCFDTYSDLHAYRAFNMPETS